MWAAPPAAPRSLAVWREEGSKRGKLKYEQAKEKASEFKTPICSADAVHWLAASLCQTRATAGREHCFQLKGAGGSVSACNQQAL